LEWKDCRSYQTDIHFDFIGKWGIERWARIPILLFEELHRFRNQSSYVFAGYVDQLRDYYLQSQQNHHAMRVGDVYSPKAIADWFHDKLRHWHQSTGAPPATQHVFRKTFLQFARRGDNRAAAVANDARVSKEVLERHYTDEEEEELRQMSNRIFDRLMAGLPLEVLERYGQKVDQITQNKSDLLAAYESGDWPEAARLAAELNRLTKQGDGDNEKASA
jgi:hypothetical protein